MHTIINYIIYQSLLELAGEPNVTKHVDRRIQESANILYEYLIFLNLHIHFFCHPWIGMAYSLKVQ